MFVGDLSTWMSQHLRRRTAAHSATFDPGRELVLSYWGSGYHSGSLLKVKRPYFHFDAYNRKINIKKRQYIQTSKFRGSKATK